MFRAVQFTREYNLCDDFIFSEQRENNLKILMCRRSQRTCLMISHFSTLLVESIKSCDFFSVLQKSLSRTKATLIDKYLHKLSSIVGVERREDENDVRNARIHVQSRERFVCALKMLICDSKCTFAVCIKAMHSTPPHPIWESQS